MERKEVNASYEIITTFKNVMLKIPSENDKHLKFIKEHQIINDEKEIVNVPDHYRRGDIFDGNFLTRRFYVHPRFLGKMVVVDEVRLVSKIDLAKNKVSLIVDIIKHDLELLEPQFMLKCGSPKKCQNSFQIPGTNRHVSFLPITTE